LWRQNGARSDHSAFGINVVYIADKLGNFREVDRTADIGSGDLAKLLIGDELRRWLKPNLAQGDGRAARLRQIGTLQGIADNGIACLLHPRPSPELVYTLFKLLDH